MPVLGKVRLQLFGIINLTMKARIRNCVGGIGLIISICFGCSLLALAAIPKSFVSKISYVEMPVSLIDTIPRPTIKVDYWETGIVRAIYLQEGSRQQFLYFDETGKLTEFGQQVKSWVMDTVESYDANFNLLGIIATGDSSQVFVSDGWNLLLNREADSTKLSKSILYNEGSADSLFQFKFRLE